MYRVITGTGLATVQGIDVDTNWRQLIGGAVLHEVGRVPLAGNELPRVSQLAFHVAHQAIQAAGWTSDLLAHPRTALVVGTSKGPIEEWLLTAKTGAPRRVDFERNAFGLSALTADIAAEFRLGFGPRLTLAGACASGLHALIRADDLLRSGLCDRVLVVAAESSLHEIFQATFKRLGVLADPAHGCRPFDVNRQGFLLAEAASAMCLEWSAVPKKIWIDKTAMRADATHLTGLAPDGDAVMNALLAVDVLSADLIHAHGTGTPQNDAVEALAIQHTTAGRTPVIYSHKHAIGHTQGAAGLIGVVLNVEMHRRQQCLPNANTTQPMRSIKDNLTSRSSEMRINRSIVHAAGFGGAIGAIGMNSAS